MTSDCFPAQILSQTADFSFFAEASLSSALTRLRREPETGLVLLDADGESMPNLLEFLRGVRHLRPNLPVIAFSGRSGDRERYLMREGAAWHFTKGARELDHLARALRRRVMGASVAHPNATVARVPIANPFVVGRPLARAAEALYVGREEVFAWLAENLDSPSRPNALMLYGRRRVGKTSTLYQVVEGSRGRPLRESREHPIFPAYVDLQRLAGFRTEEWLRGLARDVYRQAANHGHAREAPEAGPAGESAYASLERALDRLEETLPAEGVILMAVDELEQLRASIEAGLLEPEVMPFLRSQIQHRPRLAFLCSGAYGLLESFWDPILTLSAVRELGPLDREATETLVRRPLAGVLAVEDDVVDRIWAETAGHPYYIQVLCHRLVSLINRQARRDTIRIDDIERVLQDLAADGRVRGKASAEVAQR